MKTKTWNQLKETGYVVELTEEQVAIARDKFRGEPKPFSYVNGDHLRSDKVEAKMRKARK